jgi:hypothetical protein
MCAQRLSSDRGRAARLFAFLLGRTNEYGLEAALDSTRGFPLRRCLLNAVQDRRKGMEGSAASSAIIGE